MISTFSVSSVLISLTSCISGGIKKDSRSAAIFLSSLYSTSLYVQFILKNNTTKSLCLNFSKVLATSFLFE